MHDCLRVLLGDTLRMLLLGMPLLDDWLRILLLECDNKVKVIMEFTCYSVSHEPTPLE